MRLRIPRIAVLPVAVLAGSLSACGSESDGEADTSADAGSVEIDQALLDDRVSDYQAFLVEEADTMIAATSEFTDAVRAGDIEKAKSLYAGSRYHWETIEPLAGLVASVDGAVDSRVDDFASVNEPAWTGWHRLEYMLWEEGTLTPLSTKYAHQLDRDLAPLPDKLEKLDLSAVDVSTGAAGLIEEVSEGKITGEEDRYSHTDLYDLAANINGSLRAFQAYEPVLLSVDKSLELEIEQALLAAKALLADYQNDDGSYGSYLEFEMADKQQLQAMLAGLSEDLSRVSGVLGP